MTVMVNKKTVHMLAKKLLIYDEAVGRLKDKLKALTESPSQLANLQIPCSTQLPSPGSD
jgi:hypothetical protein